MKLRSEWITLKNTKRADKPNEDLTYCNDDEKLYIVLDGVSRDAENGKYPNPSPAAEITELFMNCCVEDIKKQVYGEVDDGAADCLVFSVLKEAVFDANEKAREFNRTLGHRFPAGTVGIICWSKGERLYYIYLGDCTAELIRGDQKYEITSKQTTNIMLHKKEYTSDQIRFEICNNILHSCGYGVWDGNIGANDFLVTGSIRLETGDVILLYSDGAEMSLDGVTIKKQKELPLDQLVTNCDCNGLISNLDDQTLIRLFVDD